MLTDRNREPLNLKANPFLQITIFISSICIGFSSGGDGGENSVTMQVDSGSVGRIIGKGGSRIRELQEDSGCKINVRENRINALMINICECPIHYMDSYKVWDVNKTGGWIVHSPRLCRFIRGEGKM